jgi:nocturnin
MAMGLYTREWVMPTSASQQGDATGNATFTVMQFNVLADKPDDNSGYSFTHSPPECIAWDNRKGKIAEEILRFHPDIVCLEELNHFTDFLNPLMSQNGYKGFFLPKARSSPSPIPNDGCAVFFKPSTFSCDDQEPVHLQYTETNAQVALIVRLTHINTSSQVLVACTHLKAAKNSSGEEMRVMQARMLLDKLTELSNGGDIPIILCADLNAQPHVVDDMKPLTYTEINQHALGLESAYRFVLGEEPFYTTWKIRVKEVHTTIDYIFASKQRLSVSKVLSIPRPEDLESCKLPGHRYPSDHMAIMAELAFVQKQ